MNPITFPGLNISLLIDRVAFQIGGIEIYWYAILIVSAFIIALLLCKKDDGKYQIRFDDILNLFFNEFTYYRSTAPSLFCKLPISFCINLSICLSFSVAFSS